MSVVTVSLSPRDRLSGGGASMRPVGADQARHAASRDEADRRVGSTLAEHPPLQQRGTSGPDRLVAVQSTRIQLPAVLDRILRSERATRKAHGSRERPKFRCCVAMDAATRTILGLTISREPPS